MLLMLMVADGLFVFQETCPGQSTNDTWRTNLSAEPGHDPPYELARPAFFPGHAKSPFEFLLAEVRTWQPMCGRAVFAGHATFLATDVGGEISKPGLTVLEVEGAVQRCCNTPHVVHHIWCGTASRPIWVILRRLPLPSCTYSICT